MKISQRGSHVKESPLRVLAVLASQVEDKGKKVYRLNVGEPDDYPPGRVFDALTLFKKQKIKYAPAVGLPELIEAWQSFYKDVGINVNSNELVVTSGASEALIFALAALADANDEVIVFEPYYANYTSLATLLGVKLVPLKFKKDGQGYKLPSRNDIEDKITDRTKAILFDNPSNPSGYHYSTEDLKTLGELAIKHGITLIGDEVYRGIAFEGSSKSLLTLPGYKDNVVIVDSVSKRFNLCGLRIGCLVCRDQKLIAAVRRFAQGRMAISVVDQKVAVETLNNSLEHTQNLVQIYQKRRQVLIDNLGGLKEIEISIPAGTFYSFIRLPGKSSDEFARWLLTDYSHDNQTVAVAPGGGFYLNPQDGQEEFRIALVLKSDELQIALGILRKAIQEFVNK
ncbi:pyridoxal phosphate-dependent aminotransferase [Patescibacteria group bacterium]|nr:pyridoxal phosphate-dependent aminotransferase [Patescibacteria group bacterium]MBU1890075.1 pyridoxal phosphate-dependent aminotransferase [Patescibacteria group bacterium]